MPCVPSHALRALSAALYLTSLLDISAVAAEGAQQQPQPLPDAATLLGVLSRPEPLAGALAQVGACTILLRGESRAVPVCHTSVVCLWTPWCLASIFFYCKVLGLAFGLLLAAVCMGWTRSSAAGATS